MCQAIVSLELLSQKTGILKFEQPAFCILILPRMLSALHDHGRCLNEPFKLMFRPTFISAPRERRHVFWDERMADKNAPIAYDGSRVEHGVDGALAVIAHDQTAKLKAGRLHG